MGGLKTRHVMWVADIVDQCILGLDFLQSNGCQVDLGTCILYVGVQQIPLHKASHSYPSCYRVITSGEVTIPAATEVIVPGIVVNKPPLSSAATWGVVEPTHPSLLVGKTLVNL